MILLSLRWLSKIVQYPPVTSVANRRSYLVFSSNKHVMTKGSGLLDSSTIDWRINARSTVVSFHFFNARHFFEATQTSRCFGGAVCSTRSLSRVDGYYFRVQYTRFFCGSGHSGWSSRKHARNRTIRNSRSEFLLSSASQDGNPRL